MSSNPAFSDALARAKEIAARLTNKAAPVNHLDKKRNMDGEEMDESQSKRLNFSDAQVSISAPPSAPMPSIHAYAQAQAQTQASTQTPAQVHEQALFAPIQGYASAPVAPRSLKTTMELTIASSKVGLVIGARGETLKRIERATDTKITFEQPSAASNETNERRLYIVGVPEDCESAKRLVLEKAEDHFPQSTSTRSYGPGSATPRDAFGNPLPSVHFTIPNSKVGLCIGRGGETIRELQDRSGAKIYVSPDSSTSPDPNERLITVTGSEDSINTAKMLIEEVLESGGVRALQEKGLLGSQIGGHMGGQMGGSSVGSGPSVTLCVPDQMVGMLIGKRGENFRAMVSSSRAKISIDPPTSNGTPMRYIYISGPPECVMVAQRMIHEKLAGIARLDGNTYVPITDPNAGAAAAYASDPYAYYYGPQYAQYQAYYADPNHAAAVARSPTVSAPASEVATVAAAVPAETLKQYYEYYYQYYVQAGCDATTAAQAAQSALVAAGMPAYTGESSTLKEQQHERDQKQDQNQQDQQEQDQQEQDQQDQNQQDQNQQDQNQQDQNQQDQNQQDQQERDQQEQQERDQQEQDQDQQEQQQDHEKEKEEENSPESDQVSHRQENGHIAETEEENQ